MIVDAARRLHTSGYARLAKTIVDAWLALKPRDSDALRLAAQLATERGDLTNAATLCRRLLAIVPDDTNALRVLGEATLRGPEPQSALQYFEAHDRLVHGPGVNTRVFQQSHLDEATARRGVPYFVRLENVLVDTAYWSIMAEGGIVYSYDVHGRNLANSPFVRGRTFGEGGHSVIATFGPPAMTIDRECILVGGDENFSHWVFRNLLKLGVLDADGTLDRLPWLLNSDLKAYQLEWLDLLGVTPDRRMLVDRGTVVHCAKLVVPALLTDPRTIRRGIEWINKRVSACLAPPECADRIYFSRADAPLRQIANEAELYAALEKFGFRRITPGRMSVTEQIRAFSGAKILVGAHGAGMTNIVFARPGTAVVELGSSVLARMDDFRRAASAIGLLMRTFVSEDYVAGEWRGVQTDYFVDIDAVVAHVAQLCERAGGAVNA